LVDNDVFFAGDAISWPNLWLFGIVTPVVDLDLGGCSETLTFSECATAGSDLAGSGRVVDSDLDVEAELSRLHAFSWTF